MTDRPESSSSTATQANSTFTRRGVMRKATAVGVGSAATVGGASRMGGSPVGSARAIAPALVVGGGIAAGAAASYLIKNVDNPFTGNTNENYSELAAEAFHQRIRENALTVQQADAAVLGNFQNLLNSSSNHVIAQAKKAGIDELNKGNTEQDAKDAIQAEIDQFYKTQQKNLISHWNAQINRILSWHGELGNYGSLNTSTVFGVTYGPETDGLVEKSETYTLADGTNYSYTRIKVNKKDSSLTLYTLDLKTEFDNQSEHDLVIKPVDTGETVGLLDVSDYQDILNEISTLKTDISSEMTTWIEGVAPKYKAGDINTSDMISANDLVGDSQTQDGFSFAGASLASMGLKSNDFALRVELVETGETVDGAIYHQDDSISSLQKDVQYDPQSDIAGTVYLAYNVTNTDADLGGETNTTNTTNTSEPNITTDGSGALIALEEPFIIRSVTDEEGNEYNAANFESKNQQSYSQDIEEIQKELDRISEIREELEKQRDAAGTDGGAGAGFFSGGDTQTLGLVAAAGAIIALLLGNR